MEVPSLAQLISPEVDDLGRVTVRLMAPEAKTVTVVGFTEEPLALSQKDADSPVWEVQTPALQPEIYDYFFEVDGTFMIDPHNRRVKKWRRLASMVEVNHGEGEPPLHAWREVPHGALTKHRYASRTTGGERSCVVYTPPGYETGESSTFPVVFLLHGFGDDEQAWEENGRAHIILDNLIAAEKCRPMIVVMPYGHPVPVPERVEFDTYAEGNGAAMERDLFDDLLPFVSRRYRLSQDREDRAIVGLSMGGGQALAIGLRHLETFAWVGGFSSAAPQGELGEQFPRLVKQRDAANERLKLLWIGCGEKDFLLERNREFVEQLKSHGVDHCYEETEGAHTWSVWRKYWAVFSQAIFR